MKVVLKYTSFRLRDDTESLKETPEVVKFLDDHGVPYTRYIQPKHSMSGVNFPEEKMVSWHESNSIVEIPCTTLSDLQKYCNDYNCTFEVKQESVVIAF